jgi:hypothetical protein
MCDPTAAITTLLASTRPAELQMSSVNDDTLQAMAGALKHNSTLRALAMESRNTRGKGCDAIFHALAGHRSVERLHWCATTPLLAAELQRGRGYL